MDILKQSDIKITPVEGKNGLYRIEIENDRPLTFSEISKILRKPLPKVRGEGLLNKNGKTINKKNHIKRKTIFKGEPK